MKNNEQILSAAKSLLKMQPQTQIKTLITWFEYDQLHCIAVYTAFLELIKKEVIKESEKENESK